MKIGSLNVHYDLAKVLTDQRNNALLKGIDILLVQEFQSSREAWEDEQTLCRIQGGWKESYAEPEPVDYPDPRVLHGIAIFSRYPLIEKRMIPLPRIACTKLDLVHGFRKELRQRMAITCAITTEKLGKVRIVNTHLDTQLTGWERLAQFRPIPAAVAADPRVLVAGDLNATPFGSTRHPVRFPVPQKGNSSKIIWKLMEAEDFQPTFKGRQTLRWFPLQLDEIFTRDIMIKARGTETVHRTDHRLLWVTM